MTEETKTEMQKPTKKKWTQKPNPLDSCDRDLKAKVVISQIMRDLRIGAGGGAAAEKEVITWFHSRYPLDGAAAP